MLEMLHDHIIRAICCYLLKNRYLYAPQQFLNWLLNGIEGFWANQLIYANLDDQNVGTIHIKGNYAGLFEYCVLLLMWFWFKKFKPIQNKKKDIVDSFVLLSALYSITLGHLVLRPITEKIWHKEQVSSIFEYHYLFLLS